MKRFSLTTLRVQAILWTLLPLTIIFLIVASVGVYAYGEVVSRLVHDRDRELAKISAARLSENMQAHASLLKALAEHPFMRSDNFASQKSILFSALEQGSLHAYDGGITLLDAQGVPEITAASVRLDVDEYDVALPIFPDTNFANAPFFRVPQEQGMAYFSDVISTIGEPRIIVSYPIWDDKQGFVGVLAGSFLLENRSLGDGIRNLGVGTAYLVDENGRVIWHPDPALIGRDFSDQAPVQALRDRALELTTYRGSDETGETVIFGPALVEATGWGLVIQEQWGSVIRPVQNFQWIMLGTLIVGLLLVLVIISTGTNRLTDPIRELVDQTQQLAHGELVGLVEGGSIDEMRALSAAFNEMADRVARYRAGLQSYVAAITQSQEEERKRIARELHDDTVQSLIALGRRLELLSRSLENPVDAAKQLYQLEQMLAQTVQEVRQFSRDLRPLLLEDLGLEAAIRQMLREIERLDAVETTLTIAGEMPVGGLDDELEVTLYRIAQEALNNTRKHAGASRVGVILAYEAANVRLNVRDDGCGFAPSETSDLAQQGSFGLMGIRERAKLFGGRVEIQSTPGEGTEIEINLPFTITPEWILEELRVVTPAPAALPSTVRPSKAPDTSSAG
ncbi:MAG: ATP-binding protein [Ardenticatenaceae bacterium]